MATEEWTRLVQQIDRLIAELKQARSDAARWRTRATELEGLQGRGDREARLEAQAKERELERLRRERKKTVAAVEQILAELEIVQQQVIEGEERA